MEVILRVFPKPAVAVLAVLVLAGCADAPKPETPAGGDRQANRQTNHRVESPPNPYKADYRPHYPETFSKRPAPARIFRDKREVDLNRMVEIGTLSTRIAPGECGAGKTCDATAGLAQEAAARGGDHVLLTVDNEREHREAEPGGGVSLVSGGIVYREGDFALLTKAAVKRADDALRRAEAAARRAEAAYRRATEARRAMDAGR